MARFLIVVTFIEGKLEWSYHKATELTDQTRFESQLSGAISYGTFSGELTDLYHAE
jgi:hypothetical protein